VLAEAGDFVVLGGEPGQGLGLDVGELGDRLVTASDALLEGVELVRQPGDLGVARVGEVADGVESLQALFELLAEVGVGAGAVECGAFDVTRCVCSASRSQIWSKAKRLSGDGLNKSAWSSRCSLSAKRIWSPSMSLVKKSDIPFRERVPDHPAAQNAQW